MNGHTLLKETKNNTVDRMPELFLFFLQSAVAFVARQMRSDGGFVSRRTPSEAQRNFHL